MARSFWLWDWEAHVLRVPSLRTLMLAAASVVAGCALSSDAESDALAGIAVARTAVWNAHEQGDAEALANLMTEDALLWAPGMEAVTGRTAIRSAAEGMFAAMSISDFEIESREVDVHGDMAYELATYAETLTYQGAEPSAVRGRYLIVWKRGVDGRWLVHRHMFHFVTGA